MRETLTFIAVVLAIFTALLYAAAMLAGASCSAEWKDSVFPQRYSLLGGCQIQLKDGTWIPAANYREQ